MGLVMLGRQKYTQKKPLMPEQSALEVEMAIEKSDRHKSPGTGQIPGELVKAACTIFALRSTNLPILFGIRRNCLRSGRSQSLYRGPDKSLA